MATVTLEFNVTPETDYAKLESFAGDFGYLPAFPDQDGYLRRLPEGVFHATTHEAFEGPATLARLVADICEVEGKIGINIDMQVDETMPLYRKEPLSPEALEDFQRRMAEPMQSYEAMINGV